MDGYRKVTIIVHMEVEELEEKIQKLHKNKTLIRFPHGVIVVIYVSYVEIQPCS